MGVGFIPQSTWARLEKDDNIVEAIWTIKVAYAKSLKVAWAIRNSTLESNKCNRAKEMDVVSKHHYSKIIHGRCVSKLLFFFLHCLYLSIGIFFFFFLFFFNVKIWGTTKKTFTANAIWLALHLQLFTHHHAT
jgi:hypothetical protein